MRGAEQSVECGQPTQAAPKPLTMEVWLWNTLVVGYRQQIQWGLAAMLAGVTIAAAAGFGGRIWRIAATEKSLQRIEADYAWLYQTLDLATKEAPQWSQEKWAETFGNPVISEIALVKILSGDPDDEQLSFLENLRELRSFELRSDAATDKTLASISTLPNLRYLTLIGEKFSVLGLLQLRAAPNLVQIRCDTNRYTAIELAVLQAELPGVKISNARTDHYEPYRSLVHDFTPAA